MSAIEGWTAPWGRRDPGNQCYDYRTTGLTPFERDREGCASRIDRQEYELTPSTPLGCGKGFSDITVVGNAVYASLVPPEYGAVAHKSRLAAMDKRSEEIQTRPTARGEASRISPRENCVGLHFAAREESDYSCVSIMA